MTESRIATTSSRQGQPERSARRHRWATYLVTAPHAALVEPYANDLPKPYGPWHARQVGSMRTACGMSAVTWHYFWTLEFVYAGSHACPECYRVVNGWAATDRL